MARATDGEGPRLSVFLSYAFSPRNKVYERSEILAVLERACATAQADGRAAFPSLSYTVDAELVEYGGQLNTSLHEHLAEADICIVDISDNNPNVFYELGVIHKAGVPAILIKGRQGADDLAVPSDIAGTLYLSYEQVGDIVGRLANAILTVTRQILARPRNRLDLCRSVWGDSASHSIVIVPPRSSSNTKFAQPLSPNYIDLDRLGDKDAVLELSVLMARMYPETPVVRYPSDDLPRDAYEQHLLVVGGPGGSDGASNRLVGPLHERLGIAVCYDDACEAMYVRDQELRAEFNTHGVLTRDYGFVARAPSPFNPDRMVAMIHGIHTLGALASARLLSDHPSAQANVELLARELGPSPSFWAWFTVDVVDQVPIVPLLDINNVYALP